MVALGVLAGALGLSLLVGLYELCKTQPSHQYQTNRCQLLPRPGQLLDCNLPSNSVTSFLFCLARLALIIAYFYTCDRTNFFMKENKYFTPINFWLPVLYVTVLGIFFNEESSYTVRSPFHTCRNFLVKWYYIQVILHRDQTDEWRGWMMMVRKTYHGLPCGPC